MESFIKAFTLGLTLSPVCVFTCTPLIIPFILSEGLGFLRSIITCINFLLGRLLGYLSVGAFAWYVSKAIFRNVIVKDLISGIAFFILSLFLLKYVFSKQPTHSCNLGCHNLNQVGIFNFFSKTAIGLGFVTAFNICPPILIAVFEAANKKGLLNAISFYFAFFLGSSIYFVIIPFLNVAIRGKIANVIGKLFSVIVGAYYLYQGTFKVVSALVKYLK